MADEKQSNTFEEINHRLPAEGFVRVKQLCNRKGKDGRIIYGILSISKSSFWAGLREGRFPLNPIKLGKRTTAFKVDDVRRLINGEAAQ